MDVFESGDSLSYIVTWKIKFIWKFHVVLLGENKNNEEENRVGELQMSRNKTGKQNTVAADKPAAGSRHGLKIFPG